ncbi:cytochrome b-c1 complex subunit 8 [Macrosteles quadrilineatus]|uniref:cytochrome b-c1 complex subunit 8 n=1 Tax=Macrosteles quadrilineatus TaxID=74068 RepID=UPI0023E28731|nr:cytochrome b-c1 complex subunit 8 [Macrosteles quadrilineatus]XP_054268433.1 cytochrome b-c1 complex subunit 8 [Macrosteles quadrilineatus]
MRQTLTLLGKHFGELATVRGIITYKLSPFEQRAFAGAISQGLPNIFRRIRAKLFIVAPPFMLGYLVYTENEKIHKKLMRKNPDDFKDDK